METANNQQQLEIGYTIPKPTHTLWTKALGSVVLLALVGLGIVAFETFNLFHGPFVAGIFGLVIELGAVTDAAGLANGINLTSWKAALRSLWIIPAIAITLIVSGWYNYAVVERAGALLTPPVTDPWILHAVAWGPLASTFFMAIGLGIKIADLDELVRQWERGKQAWADDQKAQAEQAHIAEENRQHEAQEKRDEAARIERENALKLQAQLEAQKERDRLASQERIRAAELEVEEREKKRAFRLEARRLTQEVPGEGGRTSIEVSRGAYQDFVELLTSNGTHEYTNRELAQKFGVTTRTITEWRAKRRGELTAVSIETVNN